MKRIIMLLLCCLPIGALAQTKSHRRAEEILQMEDRWREAQHRNDKTAFDQILSPDLTFIGTSGSFRNKDDFINSRNDSWIPRAESYTYSEITVRFYGGSAIVTGREATTGKGVAFQARFTHVWAKSKGKWRLEAIQRTDITP
ncbi:MAG TPA: nuclear transport factor 2 family protein [Candidatus Saccharimonadales bacterium]|nr:nuclear transport factor 2 family protein [Candidatus Saccharimonadales bacterium]